MIGDNAKVTRKLPLMSLPLSVPASNSWLLTLAVQGELRRGTGQLFREGVSNVTRLQGRRQEVASWLAGFGKPVIDEVKALLDPSIRMPEKLFVNALVAIYTIGRMPDAYWTEGRAQDFAQLVLAVAQDVVASGSVSRMNPWLQLLPFVYYKSGQDSVRLISTKEVLIICTAAEAGRTPRKSPAGLALQAALLNMASESELAARFALPEAEYSWKEVAGAVMRNFRFQPGKRRTQGGFSTFCEKAETADDPAAPHFAAAAWLAGRGLPGLPGERTWQFLAHPPKNELPDYLGGDTGEGSNHPLRVQARRCCGVKFEPAPFGLPTTGVKWTKPKQNQPGAFEPDLDAGRKLTARNIAQLSLLKVN